MDPIENQTYFFGENHIFQAKMKRKKQRKNIEKKKKVIIKERKDGKGIIDSKCSLQGIKRTPYSLHDYV